ncbi:MAG: hypothetical protein MJK18_05140, partial [Bdellovibrionales bacterium]|nr:hypothetical protein [Bdellovibrionales bacterium]
IARNVWVMSQTQNFMRLRIVVPALNTSVDPDNGSYTKLSIDAYSPSTEEGSPELPNRTLLIKVDDDAASATFNVVDHQQTSSGSLLVSPVPRYVVSGDQYVSQWFRNDDAYDDDAYAPTQTIELQNVTEINGQKYLPVQIHPVAFNPVQQTINKTNEITIDLYLEGSAPWSQPAALANPWTYEGALKIAIDKDGLYKLSYDEMEAAGVIAPFDGVDINDLHLRVASTAISLDIDSGSGFFSSGDSLSLYVPHL